MQGWHCLAASLAIKPHDSAAVWLYLLIVGGVYRKRAVQSLIVVFGLGILAALWTYQVSPHWIQEIRSNLELVSARGGIADPGPAGISNGTGGMIINLQTVFSVFRDDPRLYNPATWVVCVPLFIAWLIRTFRAGNSRAEMWLALAALVPLSMLPIYHRPYDAKLLLLAVPACAALWAQGGARRWLGMLTTSAAIVVTSDLPATLLTTLSRRIADQSCWFLQPDSDRCDRPACSAYSARDVHLLSVGLHAAAVLDHGCKCNQILLKDLCLLAPRSGARQFRRR